jgi:hypothetical protein
VIKSFDASPDDISKATVENWSLGSLQYFLAQGFTLPFDAETINKTLYAEELIRHRVPPSNAVSKKTRCFPPPLVSLDSTRSNDDQFTSTGSGAKIGKPLKRQSTTV